MGPSARKSKRRVGQFMAWVSVFLGLISATISAFLVLPAFFWVLQEHGPAPRGYTPSSEEIVGAYWALSLIPGILALILGIISLRRRQSARAATCGMVLGLSPLLVMAFLFLTSGQWRGAPQDWVQAMSCSYAFAQQELVSVYGGGQTHEAALVSVKFGIVNSTKYTFTAVAFRFKATEFGRSIATRDFVRGNVEPGPHAWEEENLLVPGLVPNGITENECVVEVNKVAIPLIRLR